MHCPKALPVEAAYAIKAICKASLPEASGNVSAWGKVEVSTAGLLYKIQKMA
jgi:hypothetical protein